MGASDCGVPLNGIAYVATRQPIDLELWPMAFEPDAAAFTTIGHYRQEGSDADLSRRGVLLEQTSRNGRRSFPYRPRTSQRFELALVGLAPGDQAYLERHGWHVSSAYEMSLDVFGRYPDFFRRSRAELTVAKDQNVRLRSGWFSERDACYLATGKPVVAQNTGFRNVIPTGQGLFAFTTADEAREAVEAINLDYRRHCLAARAIAEEYFEAKAVAARLLAGIGLA